MEKSYNHLGQVKSFTENEVKKPQVNEIITRYQDQTELCLKYIQVLQE